MNHLQFLIKAGNTNLYSYRFDWDDHRRFVVADFKGAFWRNSCNRDSFVAGDTALVGGYPLSDLIYPKRIFKVLHFKKYDEVLDKFC